MTTALITGSAIRLGKAIAISFAERGYNIALHYGSSAESAEDAAAEIRALGVQCDLFQCDLRDANLFPSLLEAVHERFPDLSVLVNSASAYTQADIADTTPDIFDHQFGVNIKAPFFLTQAFAKQVANGAVINIVDNKIGFNQFSYAAYLLAKKCLAEFTKMSAMEYAPTIRINAVCPGVVMPATTRSPEYVEWRIQGIPLKMQGDTSHITDAIHALVDNPFLTGQILTVDGGENLAHIGQNAAQFDQSKI